MVEIIDCKNRCVAAYNSWETVADRYFTFDELTCRIGTGSRAVEGVKDWRKDVVFLLTNFNVLTYLLIGDNFPYI